MSDQIVLSFDDLKNEGNTFYNQKDYEQALKLYNTAINYAKTQANKDDYNLASIYVNMALCYSSLLRYDEAIFHTKIALQHDPKYEKAYFRLIKCKHIHHNLYVYLYFNLFMLLYGLLYGRSVREAQISRGTSILITCIKSMW